MYFIIIFFFVSTMWYYDCYFHIIRFFSFIITHLIIYFVVRIFFMLFCFVFDKMRQRQSQIMTHSKIVSIVWVFAWIIHESTYFSSFSSFFPFFLFFFCFIVFITSIHPFLWISYQKYDDSTNCKQFSLKIIQFFSLKVIKLISNSIGVEFLFWLSGEFKEFTGCWASTIAMCVCFFSSLECIALDYSRSFVGMHRILSRSRFFVCFQA